MGEHKSIGQRIERSELRKRLTRSLLAGVVFVAAVAGSVYAVRTGPRQDDLPVILRDVQKLNEKVGRKIEHQTGAPFKPLPPPGKQPRVNGLIGLADDVDSDTYRVKVDSGAKHFALSTDEIEAMPRSAASVDFKCVEGWTEVFAYAGVKFSDFMRIEKVGLHDDGTPYPYVGLETPDGKYFVSLDIRSMMAPDTMIAWEMNGAELSIENGFPLRLMIPSKYGIKNLKRIGHIFFSDTRPPDYWQRRGYDWFSGL